MGMHEMSGISMARHSSWTSGYSLSSC
jgi:hypothetical protein